MIIYSIYIDILPIYDICTDFVTIIHPKSPSLSLSLWWSQSNKYHATFFETSSTKNFSTLNAFPVSIVSFSSQLVWNHVDVIMIIHDPHVCCLACAARMAACQLLLLEIKHNNIKQPSFPFHISWAAKWEFTQTRTAHSTQLSQDGWKRTLWAAHWSVITPTLRISRTLRGDVTILVTSAIHSNSTDIVAKAQQQSSQTFRSFRLHTEEAHFRLHSHGQTSCG